VKKDSIQKSCNFQKNYYQTNKLKVWSLKMEQFRDILSYFSIQLIL
jgi:hypothetical protein